MGMFSGDIGRYRSIISTLFAIACIGYLIAIYLLDIETEVMFGRFENADAIWRGVIPSIEYPPFALVFMLIPRIFASTPYWYNVGYVAEIFVFMVIGLILISKLAERFQYNQKKAMLLYAVLMLLMLEFVLDRFDIIPAVFTLGSFYCFVTKRYGWAFALLSMGTMTKLYPAIIFPLYLIPFILKKEWLNTLKYIGIFVITALVVTLPAFLIDPSLVFDFLGYHSDRPLQIESVFSSLIYPLSMLGLTDVSIDFSFGSDNLIGPLPDAIAPLLTPLMIVAIVAMYLVYAHFASKNKESEIDMSLFGTVILVVVLLFILVGKVFSAQYLIWIIPPLIFILMMSSEERYKRDLLILMILSLIITQLEFAYNVGYLGGGANINDLGMMIVLVRNIVVIVMLYKLLKNIWVRYHRTSGKNPQEDLPSG